MVFLAIRLLLILLSLISPEYSEYLLLHIAILSDRRSSDPHKFKNRELFRYIFDGIEFIYTTTFILGHIL